MVWQRCELDGAQHRGALSVRRWCRRLTPFPRKRGDWGYRRR